MRPPLVSVPWSVSLCDPRLHFSLEIRLNGTAISVDAQTVVPLGSAGFWLSILFSAGEPGALASKISMIPLEFYSLGLTGPCPARTCYPHMEGSWTSISQPLTRPAQSQALSRCHPRRSLSPLGTPDRKKKSTYRAGTQSN